MKKSIVNELDDLKQMIEDAKKMPFSNHVIIDKDEILGIVMRIEAMLPEEVRQAVNISKQKEEVLAEAYREKEKILREADEEFKRKLSESSILEEAQKMRNKILEEANDEAQKIREDALKYAIDVINKLEGFIEKAGATIQQSREELENEIGNK